MSVRVSRARLDVELAVRGWTGQDLAVATGLSAATVSAARQGRRVHARTLTLIAVALHNAPVVEGVSALIADRAFGSE